MRAVKPRKPKDTAKHMREKWGKDASIHATYNLMQWDTGSQGYGYWAAVLDCLRAIKEKRCSTRRTTTETSTSA